MPALKFRRCLRHLLAFAKTIFVAFDRVQRAVAKKHGSKLRYLKKKEQRSRSTASLFHSCRPIRSSNRRHSKIQIRAGACANFRALPNGPKFFRDFAKSDSPSVASI